MSEDLTKDLIIIGGGINGLSAGLAYALNCDMSKRKVLIIEKGPICGGYVTSYVRKGYHFDTCQMISNVSEILEYFGISLEWKEFKEDFMRIFKADTQNQKIDMLELCSGGKEFRERMLSLFPQDSVKLANFFDYSISMFAELYGLKYDPNPIELARMLFACPKVVKNASKNFDDYLGLFGIDNPDIKLVFQTFSGFCGLPNDRIAALLSVGVMCSLLEKAYRPKELFIELPQKMEKRFLELGGEIIYRSEAERILVKNGEVRGVRLKNATEYYSTNIISAIDVKSTFGGLVEQKEIRSINKRYAVRVDQIEMTTSAFTVNLGLDSGNIPGTEKLNCGYALLTSGNKAFANLYNSHKNNEFALAEDCFNLGISYQCGTGTEKSVLSIQAIPSPMLNWKELREGDRKNYRVEKEKISDLIIALVQKYLIPNLSEHIVVKDISTPATYARYSGSPTGSIYDMASVPQNFGRNRLPVLTPIKGLLLPKFAHGVFGAMNSGMQAVDILLDGAVMGGNSRFGRKRLI
jgi:phytoene dehydrogenase-like protein